MHCYQSVIQNVNLLCENVDQSNSQDTGFVYYWLLLIDMRFSRLVSCCYPELPLIDNETTGTSYFVSVIAKKKLTVVSILSVTQLRDHTSIRLSI